MTREEAMEILTHNWTRVDNPNYSESELDEAFFMAIEALSERNIARDIATILENEQDMRVMLQNDAVQADDRIEQNKIYCSPLVAENVEVVVRCKDCRHGQYDATHYFCAEHYHKVYEDDYCSYGERRSNRREEVNGFKSVGQAWNTSQERWEK